MIVRLKTAICPQNNVSSTLFPMIYFLFGQSLGQSMAGSGAVPEVDSRDLMNGATNCPYPGVGRRRRSRNLLVADDAVDRNLHHGSGLYAQSRERRDNLQCGRMLSLIHI